MAKLFDSLSTYRRKGKLFSLKFGTEGANFYFFRKGSWDFWMTSSFQPLTRKRKPNGPD